MTIFSYMEPDIRRLIHYHTSWSAIEDKECIGVSYYILRYSSLASSGTSSPITRTDALEYRNGQ